VVTGGDGISLERYHRHDFIGTVFTRLSVLAGAATQHFFDGFVCKKPYSRDPAI